jgi:GNAT superfamily N-acetyltransferase
VSAVLAHRPATAIDLPFIMSSWLRSFKTSHFAGPIPNDIYWDTYRLAAERILSRPAARLLVAVNPSERDPEHELYGWLAMEPGEPPVVHYVYVKQAFRRMGVARSLLRAASINLSAPFVYTYRTRDVAAVIRHARLLARHDPHLVRRPTDEEMRCD